MATATAPLQIREITPQATTALSIARQQTAPLPLLQPQGLQHVAASSGVCLANVETIAAGLAQTMRRLERDDSDGFFLAVAAVLKNCARTYCGASKIEEATIEEMGMFVLDRFGMYGVAEIELAFSLAAAGELGESVDLKSYYGQFSVAALGGVLNAYRNYRSRVVLELSALNSKLELAAPKQVFDPEEFIYSRLESLFAKETVTVKDFTKFDYEVFVDTAKLCMLPKAECFAVWEESTAAVNRILSNQSLLGDREARRLINWVENPDFKSRRQDWSRAEVLRRWFTALKELALLIERNVPQKESLEHQGQEAARA